MTQDEEWEEDPSRAGQMRFRWKTHCLEVFQYWSYIPGWPNWRVELREHNQHVVVEQIEEVDEALRLFLRGVRRLVYGVPARDVLRET